MEVVVTIKTGKGQPHQYTLHQTAEPRKAKDGSMTKSVWQAEDDNKVLLPFGKLYIDIGALAKK